MGFVYSFYAPAYGTQSSLTDAVIYPSICLQIIYLYLSVGRLNTMYSDMKEKLVNEICAVDHLCTTADIWSANHKSFLGVTGHWIDPSSLQRRSAALACERMVGRHTYDAIAAKLTAVHSSYRVGRKVVMTD